MPITVQIVVPVRGAHEALRLCLACVEAHTARDSFDVTIACCADEGDGVRGAIGEVNRWPCITTTREPRSFAANCNIGASAARSEFLVFLNSDAFVGPGWLDALLAPFADPDVVAVGPMGTNVSGHQGGGVPGWPDDFLGPGPAPADIARLAAEWRQAAPPGTYRARRLVGFCLAVRRSAWDEVGGFDERFENAYCDDDLSLRLNLVGDCVVVPDLLVLHAGSASFAELPDAETNYRQTIAENEARFREKWSRRGLLPFLYAWFQSRGVR